MNISYSNIINQLEPYKDRIFYYPLSEDEVNDIEKKISKVFPDYYREFLKIFGIKQDLVFGLLRNEYDFIKRSNYLPKEVSDSFILIGDNGGEDFWLLNANDQNDTNIYEWQHWADGDIVKLGYNFEQLLNQSVLQLSDTSVERVLNENKGWSVQFAILTNNEEAIYSCIPLTLLQDWKLKMVSPVRVSCYEANARFMDKIIIFKKYERRGWDSPAYYFDLRIPVNEIGKNFLIKEIDARLKSAFPNYKLIDYGILPLREDENNNR